VGGLEEQSTSEAINLMLKPGIEVPNGLGCERAGELSHS
jgi:hypothetical protein